MVCFPMLKHQINGVDCTTIVASSVNIRVTVGNSYHMVTVAFEQFIVAD